MNAPARFASAYPGLTPPGVLRWLYLDLNSYFASVEQQCDPKLRGRPVIVAPGGGETTVAIAASKEAKRYGIGTGTKVWEARRMCRDLVVVPAHHDLYVTYHHRILAEVERHIPIEKVCSIDEVACRLLDNETDPGFIRALSARIKAGLRERVGECLTASIGVAPNRLLAKLASDLEKPDGLVIIEAHELPERLFKIPLRAICGIGVNQERRLARRGINDIAQYCARRPRDAGSAWGGVNGDRLWYALHGFDLPDTPTKSRSIGHSSVLAPSRRDAEGARLTARRLALKAASRLRRKGYRTRLVLLHARFEDDAAKFEAGQKITPTQDSFVILATLNHLWQRLRAESAARRGGIKLRKVGVTLAEIEPVLGEQHSLFAQLDPNDPLARETRTLSLSRAMDRINARFGRNAVSVGADRDKVADAVGLKVAFNRIPEIDEFNE